MHYKNSKTKPRILMIGPCPPPYGGIATFIKNISESQKILEVFEIKIHRVGRRTGKLNLLKQVWIDVFDIIKFLVFDNPKNFDIVHIHTSSYWGFYRSSIYLYLVKLLSKKTKIILHVHGGEFDRFYEKSNKIIKKVIKIAMNLSDAIVVVGLKWKILLQTWNIPIKKIFLINNGFDNDIFYARDRDSIRKKYRINCDNKILINVANLEKYKGHVYLIEAIEQLARKYGEKIKLYVIGNGQDRNLLQNMVYEKKLHNNVFFLGKKTPHEIALLINASDVFVLPSLAEGNPVVMFECLGCGKPFVGTKVGGIPNIIISEDYGLLCEPADPNDLAEKILIALEKKWDSEKIIKYSEQYTWDKIAEKTLTIYYEGLKG